MLENWHDILTITEQLCQPIQKEVHCGSPLQKYHAWVRIMIQMGTGLLHGKGIFHVMPLNNEEVVCLRLELQYLTLILLIFSKRKEVK
jgi:hypothetical protein